MPPGTHAMLEIGVMLNNLERDRHRAWGVAAALGFRVVHTNGLAEAWLLDRGPALDSYVAEARASGLAVHTMFVGFDGKTFADPASAARTVGFGVPNLRAHRLQVALAYAPLARGLNARALGLHAGQAPSEDDYRDFVRALRELADHTAAHRVDLHLESGQEPAERLRRLIADVGRPNVGVNFDPANFLLYGTAEPLAALDIIGPWVRGVHCKDAVPSAVPGQMGTDVALGEGRVNFPRLLARLGQLGYTGPLVIEREHGPNVQGDIQRGRDYLRRLQHDLVPRSPECAKTQ